MIQYTFSAEGFDSTDKLQKYVNKKVRELEKYIPRRSRAAAAISVRIVRSKKSKTETYECGLSLSVTSEVLVANEKVDHPYAALDVTLAEIRRQLAEYKGRQSAQSLRRRALAGFRRDKEI